MTPFYDPDEIDAHYARAGSDLRVQRGPATATDPTPAVAVLLAMVRYGWPVLVILVAAIIIS